MVTKTKAKPNQSTTFSASQGNQLNLGDFIKAFAPKLPLKYTDPVTGVVTDYTKTNLLYYPQGSSIGVTPTKSTLLSALNWLSGSNPALGMALMDHLNLNETSTGTAVNDAYDALTKAHFNLGKVQSPQVSSLKATVAGLTKALGDQTAAGISSATASQQANAIDNVRNTIESWNYTAAQKDYISSLVQQLVTVNGDHIVNQNALLDIFRGDIPSGLGKATDAKIKADYNAAFPGLNDYNNQPGAVHMTESQYTQYSTTVQNSATQYGAPMPSQADIGKLLTGHVSAAEYQQRVTDIYAAVSNADQNTKNILEKQYGVSPANLMHYFMDPKNAIQTMQRQVAGAEIQDYATRVGLKGIDQTGVNQLADMAKLAATQGNQQLGYGVGQIQNSLLNASRDVGLTKASPGAGTPTVSTNQLIGSQLAGFAGTNQIAEQVQVARAEQAAAAPFEKGGGYVENAKGVVGLGSART